MAGVLFVLSDDLYDGFVVGFSLKLSTSDSYSSSSSSRLVCVSYRFFSEPLKPADLIEDANDYLLYFNDCLF